MSNISYPNWEGLFFLLKIPKHRAFVCLGIEQGKTLLRSRPVVIEEGIAKIPVDDKEDINIPLKHIKNCDALDRPTLGAVISITDGYCLGECQLCPKLHKENEFFFCTAANADAKNIVEIGPLTNEQKLIEPAIINKITKIKKALNE